ncbi:hypothetical protein FRX31_016920 [Thalictrum thalictroides]|uniref:Uncharacterized protein n=1 Tax=Thalictrum thalictroides TaxID=46969 RepID=A0A7J6W9I2_THATH|nr:hypothetical protein FRX31_016920 [Thalictrum thalictroides]
MADQVNIAAMIAEYETALDEVFNQVFSAVDRSFCHDHFLEFDSFHFNVDEFCEDVANAMNPDICLPWCQYRKNKIRECDECREVARNAPPGDVEVIIISDDEAEGDGNDADGAELVEVVEDVGPVCRGDQ